FVFFFQAEDGIRDGHVTGVQTCALPIWMKRCISPESFTSWMTSRRYACSVQPKSLSWTPMTRAMTQLAIFEGITRLASSRLSRQIGRASCRERGEISGVEGALKGDEGKV